MTLAAFGYVWRFGSDVPFWDEWNLIDALTGAQPVTLQWLWSPHNGHRIPFPRLVLLGLYKISGADFRVGMYFNVLALAAAAAALIWASGRMRGKLSLADAVFPLLLLHWGHYENLLWSWQVTQLVPVAAVCGVLVVVSSYGFAPNPGLAALAAAGVLTLPLSGVPGLAYTPALVGWLSVTGAVAYRAGRRRSAIAIWVVSAVTLILVALYFQGYTSNTGFILFGKPRAVLKTGVKFATGGLGPVAWKLWPASGAATMVILSGTAAAIIWTSVRRDLTPHRVKALLLFLVGASCLVAAFATGRTGTSFVSRYFALATPLWCAVFLAWSVCVRPAIARLAQMSLLAILILSAPLNASVGLRYARDYHRRMEAFRADLLRGASSEELVAHHVADLCPVAWSGFAGAGLHQQWGNQPWDSGFPITNTMSFHEWIGASLRKLHDAKIGGYARMDVEERRMREIAPSRETGFTISRAVKTNGTDDQAETAVLLTPDRPLYVAGVRIRRPAGSDYVSPDDVWGHGDLKGRWVQVFWRMPGESAYTAPNRYVFLWNPGKEEQTVWIFRLVDQIALHVGDRDVQRRLGPDDLPLTVLVPAESPSLSVNEAQ